MRAILIDPYYREVSDLETDGTINDYQRLVGTDEDDRPCDTLCHSAFQDKISGWVDDTGNWTQFAWFSLAGDDRLWCGRMLLTGNTHEGEAAAVQAGITKEMVEDRVIWLSDEGAIEQAGRYQEAMEKSAKDSPMPVIHLDQGIVGRIKEAVANKQRKAFAKLEHRSYRSIPESDDYPHVGAVSVFEGDERARKLPVCLDHVNHSPDGCAWGYGGSGPAQLAYAILFDVTNDRDKSQKFYQDYKWAVISQLPRKTWTIEAEKVLDWLENAEYDRKSFREIT
jgi:hypothetical protein